MKNEGRPPPLLHRSGRDMTVGSIPRHLVLFAMPMLVGNALQNLYIFVNRFWVGRYLPNPTTAMAALTATMPAFFVLVALCIGLTMGSGILVSQAFGAKDFAAVRRAWGPRRS